ncbi:hypothetical protein TEA_014550 [Camellia sinensis var. sinensis]|uniref:non-specific serine/threonine protein kinase n=1 Tax=Camellia sinensis var. sinensis TaxID=542762 RepID=A0A4V3WNK3_CAMSN|nr:hypothetical protein TEA_014550 [Camellia sinensis var. sinensis]
MRLKPDGHLKVYEWGGEDWRVVVDLLTVWRDECQYPMACGEYDICSERQEKGEYEELEEFNVEQVPGVPTRFSYEDLRAMTNNFNNKLGFLVYEYMPNGSLDTWIFHRHWEFTLGWQSRKPSIMDIAKGLTYLHEDCRQKILHLDIKPQNILLDEYFNAKIADFGLSKLIDRTRAKL